MLTTVKPSINWEEIAREIEEEFQAHSNYESALFDSLLMTMEEV